MSDPKPAEPDDDLLEFLGGIDEVNDESQDDDFSDFLAKTDIDKLAAKKPKPPAKEGQRVSNVRLHAPRRAGRVVRGRHALAPPRAARARRRRAAVERAGADAWASLSARGTEGAQPLQREMEFAAAPNSSSACCAARGAGWR